MTTAAITSLVSDLKAGDKVRVTFGPGYDGEVRTGRLARAGLSILDGNTADRRLYLTSIHRLIRNADGLPAIGVVEVERWDDEARADLLWQLADLWTRKKDYADNCPKSEKDDAARERDEALAEFLAECDKGKTA